MGYPTRYAYNVPSPTPRPTCFDGLVRYDNLTDERQSYFSGQAATAASRPSPRETARWERIRLSRDLCHRRATGRSEVDIFDARRSARASGPGTPPQRVRSAFTPAGCAPTSWPVGEPRTTALSVSLGLWQDPALRRGARHRIAADRLGYGELWIGEMATYDAFVLGAVIGERTERISLTLGPFAVA